MQSYVNEPVLRTLPFHTDSAQANSLYAQQRQQLEQRASFIKAYQYRGGGGELGDGRKLDPVLAWHLGLTK